MRPNPSILTAMLIVVSGVAHAGMQIEVRDETGGKRYATFAWTEGTPARRETAQDRIVAAVERELRGKGLRPAEGKPDVFVATHVLVERHRLKELDDADEWEYWSGVGSVDAFDLRAGTLVVDLVDPEQNRRVWRGVGSAAVKGSVTRNLKTIDKLVRKILAELPE